MKTMISFSKLFTVIGLTVATILTVGAQSTIAGGRDQQIQVSPVALSQHLAKSPNKLSIVLVSTPGCGFCELVRERQLKPLLRDPDFKDVAVFEVLMRDDTQFPTPIKRFRDHTGADLGQIQSAAVLSEKLGISVAPTLLFVGSSRELAERLVGYGVPEYYFAYLSERIDTARAQLELNQQK